VLFVFIGRRNIVHIYVPRVPLVCLLVQIGTPPPLLLQASVSPPQQKGGHIRLRVRGVGGAGGSQSDDWRKNIALCLLCGRGVNNDSLTGQKMHA
jgi:hypothetical protein